MSGYGAANARRGLLRPRAVETPLPDVHPDDAHADRQDYLWAIWDNEQRQDRLADYGGNPMTSAKVVGLAVCDGTAGERRAA